uniref:Uncharacterized protein n=1 Tax=Noccaea caerulescens TaxID=107243 RepID=A0A1J3HQM2_NOCCA
MYICISIYFQKLNHRQEIRRKKEREREALILMFGLGAIIMIISPANKHNDASPHDVKASSLFSHQSPTLPRETVFPMFLPRRRHASVASEAFLFRR